MSKRRKGPTPKRAEVPWGPWKSYELVKQQIPENASPEVVAALTNKHDEVMWKNGVLCVLVEPEVALFGPEIPVLHLSYRTEDRKPIRDWRWTQRMKSELCGANCEGVELYPNEERLLDGSNQYHLYVFPPSILLPFGLHAVRSVADNADHEALWKSQGGDWENMKGKQRDWGPEGKDVARFDHGVFQAYGLYPEWQHFAKTLEGADD